MTAIWPEDPGWRIRAGAGLVIHCPMSDERREAVRRESEKEARAAELEAEQRHEAGIERRRDLERHGVVPVSVADRLQLASYGMDRADRVEQRREKEAAEILGQPEPRRTRWEIKQDQQAAAEKAAATPASQADLTKLAGRITSLTKSINVLKRRRSL